MLWWTHALKRILASQQSLLTDLELLRRMIMAIRDDLASFAVRMDGVTNAIAANVDIVAAKIADLQSQLEAGTISPVELAAALDPIAEHLTTVSDTLKSVAEGGNPAAVPPVEPIA